MPCGGGVGLIIYCPVAVQYLAGRGSCDESEVKALQVPLVMVPNALPYSDRLGNFLVDGIWFLQMEVRGTQSYLPRKTQCLYLVGI